MSQPRAPQPPSDPEFYERQFDQLAPMDLAALVWDTATAFTALAEPEPDECFADGFGSVGCALECFGRPERE